ncbi:MAG: tetratricopeptide repeat protein [Spirochaetes bacterium]|nr:tetratricopeptide repeat protein [Spirochaetota bacterium]
MSIIKYAIFFVTVAFLAVAFGADPAGRSWNYYYKRAQVQYRGEMLDYALASLERCLDLNPRSYQAANLMAEIYTRKNMKQRAIDSYLVSTGINDRQADVHYRLGELYEFFAERDLAFRHYTRAVEIEPDHIRAHCSLIRICHARNDPAAARRHFETGYRLGMAAAGPLLKQAAEAGRAGDTTGAAALYGRVIDTAPAMVEAYFSLYEIYRRKGDDANAAAALEKLVFVKPDHEKAYLFLGNIYFTKQLPGRRVHLFDRAIACYKKAFEINPDNYEACLGIADVYDFIGRDLDARAWKEKGMAIEERVEKKRAREN